MERNMPETSYDLKAFVLHRNNDAPKAVTVRGRSRWALEALIAAGRTGCSAFDTPAPRWAAYVHKLRALGLRIETRSEPHRGPFAGHHARYVLRDSVTPAGAGGAA